MKEKFEKAEIEIVEFEAEDIIATSRTGIELDEDLDGFD